jgi:YbbR domain-containing protein
MINTLSTRRSHRLFLAIVTGLVVLLVGALLFYWKGQEVTVAVPVRFGNVPDDLIVVGNVPALEARLKARSILPTSLKSLELTHEVELGSAKPGTLLIKISPDMIKVPRHVSVLDIRPASFALSVDKRMEKLVPIEPDLRNDPAPGFMISKVVASPATTRLTGPARVLEKLSALRTTPVDLAGLTESTKKKVGLDLNHNPYVQAVGDRLVEVEIVIEEKMVERWMDIDVQATSTNYGYEITPNQIRLLLRGPVKTVKQLAQGKGIKVYVDLGGLNPGTYVHPAVIEPPLNTTLLKATPEVFTVQVFE